VNEGEPNDDYWVLMGEGNKNKRLRGWGVSTSYSTRTSFPSTMEIRVRFSFVEGMGMRS